MTSGIRPSAIPAKTHSRRRWPIAGGFDHNAHGIRLVTKLEAPYPGFDGLNLSWEALEGLAKHNGPILSPTWAHGRGEFRI